MAKDKTGYNLLMDAYHQLLTFAFNLQGKLRIAALHAASRRALSSWDSINCDPLRSSRQTVTRKISHHVVTNQSFVERRSKSTRRYRHFCPQLCRNRITNRIIVLVGSYYVTHITGFKFTSGQRIMSNSIEFPPPYSQYDGPSP